MECVIVDTSSILFALHNRKDVFSAIRYEMPRASLLVSRGVFSELMHLKKGHGSTGRNARIALSLLKSASVKITLDSSDVDSWIFREAVRRRCMVCTNDTALKARLRRRGIKTFRITKEGRLR